MLKPFKKQNALILIYHYDNKNSSDTFPLIRVRYSQVSLINRESLDSQTVLPDINCHVWWDLICCVWVTRAWPLDRVLWTSHRVNGPGPVIHQGSSLQPQGEMSTHFLIKHAEHQISVLNLIMTLSHVSLNWMKVTWDLDTKWSV